MKLHSIELRNFRQHAHTQLTFPPEGIIGILGANESGKSTILEAITWALFGARAVRPPLSGIRWDRAPARHIASVKLAFEVGGVLHRVERTENNALLVEIDEGQTITLAAGIKAVDAYAPSLLGMTLTEYETTYLCRQKDLARLRDMGPTERKTFFLTVLGVERVETALTACRAKRNDLARTHEGMLAGLGARGALEDRQAEAEGDVREAQEALQEAATHRLRDEEKLRTRREALAVLEAQRAEREKLIVERTEAERERTEAYAKVEDLAQARDVLLKANRRLKELGDVNATLTRLHKQKDEHLTAQAAWRQAEQTRALAVQARTRATDFRTAATRERELAAGLNGAGAKADNVRARIRNLRDTVQIKEQEQATRMNTAAGQHTAVVPAIRRLEDRIEALTDVGPEAPCPFCKRALGQEHYDTVLTELREEVGQLEDEEAALTATMEDAEEQVSVIRQEYEPRIRELTDELSEHETREADRLSRLAAAAASDANAAHADLQAEELEGGVYVDATPLSPESVRVLNDAIEAARGHAVEIGAARHTSEANAIFIAENEDAPKILTEASAHVEEIKGLIEALAFDGDAWFMASENVSEAERSLADARNVEAKADGRVTGAVTVAAGVERDLKEWDERSTAAEEVAADLVVHEAAAAGLADFRTSMIGAIRPELEALTSGFIGLLTDGRHTVCEITDDYEPVLYKDGVAEPVTSGGAEDVTALAIRLATSQMIAERAGHPLSLLKLDEPFGSLDETRRQNVLNLLRRLRGVFEQVLVISHVTDTQHAADVAFECTYSEETGRSTVRAMEGGIPPADSPQRVPWEVTAVREGYQADLKAGLLGPAEDES